MLPGATIEILRECSQKSFQNMPFREVVQKLSGGGVETYHADLFRNERTFYFPNGDSHIVHDDERYTASSQAPRS